MEEITITINGERVRAPQGISILEAAKLHGIKIPSLCHHPDQRVKANCRVCVVEVEGSRNLVASCATKISSFAPFSTSFFASRTRESIGIDR